jgi:hypothetical protein
MAGGLSERVLEIRGLAEVEEMPVVGQAAVGGHKPATVVD